MPTITITKTSHPAEMTPCNGKHVTLAITGAWTAIKTIHPEHVMAKPLDAEEREQLLMLWLRVHCSGKTPAQLNTEFTNGVVAVI